MCDNVGNRISVLPFVLSVVEFNDSDFGMLWLVVMRWCILYKVRCGKGPRARLELPV